jgi:3-isopropylmalate dehydrogenase
LLVLPGDGIGPEITAATVRVLQAVAKKVSLDITLSHEVIGHASLHRFGATVRPEVLTAALQADGIVLGPCATADFKDAARGEINPSMYMRKNLDLYANIRPCRTYAGSGRLGDFDLVVVRENTEGFYADRNTEKGNAELLITPDVAISLRRVSRRACQRIARAAFELAGRRRKRVAVAHKANVLKVGDGLFVDECRAIAAEYPGVAVEYVLIDAMMAYVVRDPARFDVIVTTNMFGDLLSSLTAELSGSLGLGASLNVGDSHAMAQASHGSAPDIAGQDVANPLSLILGAALLCEWHGRRHGAPAFLLAAAAIKRAVEAAVAARETTRDLGGHLGTRAAGEAVASKLNP